VAACLKPATVMPQIAAPFAAEALAFEAGILAAPGEARKDRLPVLTALRSTPLRYVLARRAGRGCAGSINGERLERERRNRKCLICI
jgi:hypothetical protein